MAKYIGAKENVLAYIDEDRVIIKNIYSDGNLIGGRDIAAILYVIKENENMQDVILSISDLFNTSYSEAEKMLNITIDNLKHYLKISDNSFEKGKILIELDDIKKCKRIKDITRKKVYLKEVALFITKNCNRRCVYCKENASLNNNIEENNFFMNLANVQGLFDKHSDKVQYWTLTGGEPFLHPNLTEILRLLRKNVDGNISIVTKGTTDLKTLDKICEEKLIDSISFSLDSLDADIVEFLSGNKETYYDICKNIEMVKRASIDININTVLTTKNYLGIKELVKFCYDNAIKKITFNCAFNVGRCQEYLFLNEDQIMECNEVISELAIKYKDKVVPVLKIERNCKRCSNKYDRLIIKQDGTFELCNGTSLGHINNDSIGELWDNVQSI